jgi:hypothetical protein
MGADVTALSDDAAAVFARIRAMRDPRYPDAYKLLGNHPRALAAVTELVAAGLIAHRDNGRLDYLGPAIVHNRETA